MAFAVRPRAGQERVSPRELDVIRLVVEGRSNDEVGAALGIGVKTVETHLRRLFERFSVASRTELAARALREGWLDIPPAGGH
jgi:DNA-binding NarL/FixJ family response regulator